MHRALIPALLVLLAAVPARAQPGSTTADLARDLAQHRRTMRHELDALRRQVDDLMFYTRLGALADIDLVQLTGPSP